MSDLSMDPRQRARRLLFSGTNISLEEAPGQPIILRGVNLMFMLEKEGMDHVTAEQF